MSMVFCRGCGKEIHESAPTCPQCGAPQALASSADGPLPDGVKGWSWGAFLLNWIWAIGNKTWIGLLALVPYLGFIMAIVLGIKGREWAWKNKQWDSLEHFNRVQKKWSFWGVLLVVGLAGIGILAAISIPAYVNYVDRAKQAAIAQQAATDRAAKEVADAEAKARDGEARAREQAARASAASHWTAEFRQQMADACAHAAAQKGNPPNGCGCFIERAALAIPEQRMRAAESDAEVQGVLTQIEAACRG